MEKGCIARKKENTPQLQPAEAIMSAFVVLFDLCGRYLVGTVKP